MLEHLRHKVIDMRVIHEFFMMNGSSFMTIALDGIKNEHFKATLIPRKLPQIPGRHLNGDGIVWKIQLKLVREDRINKKNKITSQVIKEFGLPVKPNEQTMEEILKDKYSFLIKPRRIKKRTMRRRGELCSLF